MHAGAEEKGLVLSMQYRLLLVVVIFRCLSEGYAHAEVAEQVVADCS